jgi:hypothetical protein
MQADLASVRQTPLLTLLKRGCARVGCSRVRTEEIQFACTSLATERRTTPARGATGTSGECVAVAEVGGVG